MDPFRSLWPRVQSRLETPVWRRWRALLLFAHMATVAAVAFPAPRPVDPALWQKPTIRAELENWKNRVNAWGLSLSREELQHFIADLAASWQRKRDFVVAPLKAYVNALGVPQNWYMFTGPDRVPQRFRVSEGVPAREPRTVFELGGEVPRPDRVDPAFLHGHRVRRALFRAAWSPDLGTFDSICDYFDRHLRQQGADTSAVLCELRAQAVEHPSDRTAPRPVKTVRTRVVFGDGRVTRRWPAKTKRNRPKAAP